MATKDAPPRWDRRMQQRLAHGEAAALGELYDRFATLVHGLAHRVLGDDRAADTLTREVFVHLWEHPDTYDPKQGPLRSWVAAVTHRLAVQRLRADGVRSGAGADGTARTDGTARADLERTVRRASVAARADYIVTSLPAPLKAALERAYFQRRDYRQTAADLGITEDEARHRLRLGLQLLATAHDTGARGGADHPGGFGDGTPEPGGPV
ncbi:RNA polymerase sigma-70 factor (ECF subfamily) [Streptomyces sp. B3I7]|uniref:sigma-70 family RNA polymerase sigma factor n=1 Tax=Streptomyces sp. B3I7 TaxID=3042269 RepID=UPI00278ADC96|nr:sigma-70 family RNA polymerase sigma factor [Streptomyces sp. B3I7]MDQ0812813.1 RNA polymerase sigma-70 factor (ECF subfamily) [Streptomyces sp. B3I7]